MRVARRPQVRSELVENRPLWLLELGQVGLGLRESSNVGLGPEADLKYHLLREQQRRSIRMSSIDFSTGSGHLQTVGSRAECWIKVRNPNSAAMLRIEDGSW